MAQQEWKVKAKLPTGEVMEFTQTDRQVEPGVYRLPETNGERKTFRVNPDGTTTDIPEAEQKLFFP